MKRCLNPGAAIAGATAEEAAFMLSKKSGLQLGIQLMPGMPGQNDASFSEDVARQ